MKTEIGKRKVEMAAMVAPLILFFTYSGCMMLVEGCRSTNASGQYVYDPVKTDQVKSAVEVPLAGVIRRVILNSPQHANEISGYIRSVGSIFCQMKASGNFSPDYLIAETDKLTAPVISDTTIVDVKNTAISLYKIFYAGRLNAELSPDKWPAAVTDIICTSINTGLKDAGQPGV